MSLREYRRKRDFQKTREPSGAKDAPSTATPRFVIQKHDASRLHYDFRLEVDGVLKSWAVPKGLPAKTGEKHLAVQVEDHPLDYGDFEGTIPQGEYGGGTVMLWDHGSYEAEAAARGIAKGKLHFVLTGEKLQGEWALIRLAHGENGNEWLIFKADKDARPVTKSRDDQSAKTGRTMKQIAAAADAVWSPNSKAKAPEFIPPMLARLVNDVPDATDWLYEIKFDGYRALALGDGSGVSLLSRNRKPLDFPEIADALRALAGESFVIDGEIVALDPEGRPSFQALQRREEEAVTLAYYAFDLLQQNGRDLTAQPIEARRKQLETLLAAGDPALLRFSGELEGEGQNVLAGIRRMKLEGIIAKRRGSKYESGRRTGTWRKVKCVLGQEFVIGGFTAPGGSRQHFGALLLGYFEGTELRYAGKVGTGFSQKTLAALHAKLQPLARKTSPFASVELLSPADRKHSTWVKPNLVAEVRFTEWTREGVLRHPAFLGLRNDKAARDVGRETA